MVWYGKLKWLQNVSAINTTLIKKKNFFEIAVVQTNVSKWQAGDFFLKDWR